MSNKIKDIDIKNHTYYFIDDIINKNFLTQIELKQMKSQTKRFLFTTLDMSTIKDSKYMKINSINSLYPIISKVNEYFEEINKKSI